MTKLSAGEFESKFSELLADAMLTGRAISRELVAECYMEAAAVLGLAPTGADALHVQDMYSSLSAPGALPSSRNVAALRRSIFGVIYMH